MAEAALLSRGIPAWAEAMFFAGSATLSVRAEDACSNEAPRPNSLATAARTFLRRSPQRPNSAPHEIHTAVLSSSGWFGRLNNRPPHWVQGTSAGNLIAVMVEPTPLRFNGRTSAPPHPCVRQRTESTRVSPPAPVAPPKEQVLLEEIRDILKDQSRVPSARA
jgi:hypothetical protein